MTSLAEIMAAHAHRVERVASQLERHPRGIPVSIRKKAVPHQVPKRNDARRTDAKINLVDLDHILSIDPDAMTCTAEPGVTFEDLVAATLPLGLAPIIVPELPTITIGGAVSGCSIESMSFRYGGFHDTCLEYEVVTGRGDVLRCTPDNENALVFQMMHGSFGTLGVLTKLVFRLVPAKPFVHVVNEQHRTLGEFEAAIRRRFERGDLDFMDGFVHAPDRYTLCVGRWADDAPYAHRYDWVKVYYKTTARRPEDYLRTRDYFFRYDNGVTNPTPKNPVARLLLGKFMHSAQVLRLAEKLHRLLPDDRPNVTVDLFFPISRMQEFLAWYGGAIGHYPLWVVPYRRVRDYEWIAKDFFAKMSDPLFVDLAIYGCKQPAGRNLYEEIEAELLRVNGIKTLISHNYYDEETFWRIFNRPNYLAVKALTDPDNVFRDLYDKTCRAARPAGTKRAA